MAATPLNRHTWVTKHASGWFSHGVNSKGWNITTTYVCLFCRSKKEDALHVLTCSHGTPSLHRRILLKQFHKNVRKIILALLDALQSLWAEAPTHPSSNQYPAIPAAIANWSAIGWRNLIFSRCSWRCQLIQKAHFKYLGLKTDPKQWQVAITHLLWQTAWEMWDFRDKYVHDQTNTTKKHNPSPSTPEGADSRRMGTRLFRPCPI